MPELLKLKTKLLTAPLFHIAILITIALLAYSNTFSVPFILDDEGSILLNPSVHGLTNFFNGGYNFLPNRSFGYLTFAINFHFNELGVAGYHAVNLIIHCISSLLVYCLVRLTLKTPYFTGTFTEHQINLFAFTVALLFVSHPIQTQAVTYIVQRLTSLATLLYVAALVCYVQWRTTGVESSPFVRQILSPWYLLSFVAAVLAMKTKEIAFTLPCIILLYECSFFGWPKLKRFALLLPLLLTVVIIPYTVFVTVSPALTAGGSMLSDVNSPAYGLVRITRWEYLLTQFSVILTYLRLMILPTHQNLDYDYPISHSLSEPKVILSILVLVALFSLAVYLFKRSCYNSEQQPENKTKRLYRLAAFGIFWFFITLSVESSIIVIRDVIFEHRLYLPSVGFYLVATSAGLLIFLKFENRIRNLRIITLVCVSAITVTLAVATYSRNSVWQDWITLWEDVVAKSPNKDRAHNILGIGYLYSNRFDEALREFQEAVRLDYTYIEANFNLGLVYKSRKQHTEAIIVYQKILSMSAFNPGLFAKAYNEIGINYTELHEFDKAGKAFIDALNYSPDSIDFRNNYAYSLWMAGNLEEAIRQYQMVVALDPANSHAIVAITKIKFKIAKENEQKNSAKP